jgi:hypothetical protein
MDQHLSMQTEENIRAGMTPEEAGRHARLKLSKQSSHGKLFAGRSAAMLDPVEALRCESEIWFAWFRQLRVVPTLGWSDRKSERAAPAARRHRSIATPITLHTTKLMP